MKVFANLLLLVNEAEPWIQLWTAEAWERSASLSLAPNILMCDVSGGHSMRWVRIAGGLLSLSSVVTSSRVWHHGQDIICHVTGHSHSSQQTQSLIQPTSECRQQYLNLSSTLPQIPTKILGFQIRNILKNCISWGLENIYLSTEVVTNGPRLNFD